VYFGGGYAVTFYCILRDCWKNFWDRFGLSKTRCRCDMYVKVFCF